MPRTVTAEFNTRRDAEMAIEHVAQEHGLDPKAVTMTTATAENTAGTRTAGGDIEDGRPKTGTEGEPKLEGRLRVSVEVDEAEYEKVLEAFSNYRAS